MFWKFLKLELRHPITYVHIYTTKHMLQTLKQSFMSTQQEGQYIRKWQFQQPQSTVRTSKKEPQLLLHCTFTKTWPILQQSVSNNYYMFRLCVQPYLYSMPSICMILQYNMWPIWFHIFPHSFTKQHNFHKHVNKQNVCWFSLQKEVFHANRHTEWN